MSEENQVADAPVETGQVPSEQPAQEAPKEETQAAPDWRSQIDESYRDHPSLQHYSDVNGLAKSHINAQKMIGADKIVLPGKHASQEEVDEFYTKLGRPIKAEDYQLASQVGEGREADPTMINWFQNVAHKAGLTPVQAKVLMDEYNIKSDENLSLDEGKIEQRLQQTINELKREYGQSYNDRMQIGKAVLQTHTDLAFADEMLADGTKIGDHPNFIKFINNVGKYIVDNIGEDKLEGVKTSGGMGPEEVKAKLAEITAPNTPYWDNKHPEHSFYVQEGLRYREMLS